MTTVIDYEFSHFQFLMYLVLFLLLWTLKKTFVHVHVLFFFVEKNICVFEFDIGEL